MNVFKKGDLLIPKEHAVHAQGKKRIIIDILPDGNYKWAFHPQKYKETFETTFIGGDIDSFEDSFIIK